MLNYPLYLDNIVFNLQRAGGISAYWSELLARFDRDDENLVVLERGGAERNIFRAGLEPGFKVRREGGILPLSAARYLPVSAGLTAPCLFHSSYYRVPLNREAATVVTVHDFTYELFRSPGPARFVHCRQKGRALRRADGIICVSENTRRDLLTFYPGLADRQIRVIYHGVSDEFHPVDRDEKVADEIRDVVDGTYVIYIGDRTPYKNFPLSVRAAARFADCRLLVIGGGELAGDERRLLEEELPGRFVHLKGIDIRILNHLYNHAHALIYPSSYEGFGMPVVEAMRAGCPVLALRTSSLPEAGGEAGLFLDSPDVGAAVDLLEKLEMPDFRAAVLSRGFDNAARFSWRRCFEETLNFYQETFARKYGLELFKGISTS